MVKCATGRLALLCATLLLAGGPAHCADSVYDPARVRWAHLEFTASKLFMSARASVAAELVPAEAVAGKLLGSGAGTPVPPGPQVLQMAYSANGLGLDS